MKRMEKGMKKILKDNRGLSLVELVISIAISSFILLAAGMFLHNANKSYRIASSMVDLQMESQILMEQMSNWVLEANLIVVADDGKGMMLFYIPRDNGKVLGDLYPTAYLAAHPEDVSASYKVFVVDDGKLYMISKSGIADVTAEIEAIAGGSSVYTDADLIPDNVIGEFVTELEITVPSTEVSYNPKSIIVEMTLEEGSRSYRVRDVFSLRNGTYYEPVASPSASPEPTPTTEP